MASSAAGNAGCVSCFDRARELRIASSTPAERCALLVAVDGTNGEATKFARPVSPRPVTARSFRFRRRRDDRDPSGHSAIPAFEEVFPIEQPPFTTETSTRGRLAPAAFALRRRQVGHPSHVGRSLILGTIIWSAPKPSSDLFSLI